MVRQQQEADAMALYRHRDAQGTDYAQEVQCEHIHLDTLRNFMVGPFDDHETMHCKCLDCGAFLVGTIHFTRDDIETELTPMPPQIIAAYTAVQTRRVS